MIYELRVYHCVPGRLPDLLKRFDTITLKIWERHGIQQAGFWTVLVGEFEPGALLPAQIGLAGRSREEMECVPGRSGMASGARRDREERPDRRQGRQLVPAADQLLGGEVAGQREAGASPARDAARRPAPGQFRGRPPRFVKSRVRAAAAARPRAFVPI